MKINLLTLSTLVAIAFSANAQNVGIGTSSPNTSAKLDVSASDKGILFPNVALTGTSDASTIATPATGLIVWNTGSGGLSPAGFYYNAGTTGSPNWTKVANGAVLTNTLTDGRVLIGNASNIATEQAVSGDATISNTGVLDLSDNAVETSEINDLAVTTAKIADNAVTGGKIDISGNANGSLMYYNGTDWVNLAPGTSGQILRTNGAAAPTWVSGDGLFIRNQTGVQTSANFNIDGNGRIGGNLNTVDRYQLNGVDAIFNSATDIYANIRVLQSNSTLNDGMYINYNSTGGTAADLRFFANGTNERMRILATNGNVGIGATAPAVKLAIGGNGTNVYNTDAWIENNIHVQGNETLTQGGRGRLRVGSAWSYAGLYTDGSSTSASNDLVLGASTGVVRIGPDNEPGGQNLQINGELRYATHHNGTSNTVTRIVERAWRGSTTGTTTSSVFFDDDFVQIRINDGGSTGYVQFAAKTGYTGTWSFASADGVEVKGVSLATAGTFVNTTADFNNANDGYCFMMSRQNADTPAHYQVCAHHNSSAAGSSPDRWIVTVKAYYF